jgi:BA14K-like protein
MNLSFGVLATALMATAAPLLVTPAAAAPISQPLALQSAVAPLVETVQYRRGWRGPGLGRAGAGAALAAGAIIGGVIAASRPYPYGYYGYGGYQADYAYGPGYGYGPGPGYAYGPGSGYAYEPGYDRGYVVVAPGGQSDVAYCEQRFRSYDRASGSYLGFDGLRHPCP